MLFQQSQIYVSLIFSDIYSLSLLAGIPAVALCMVGQFSGQCQYVRSVSLVGNVSMLGRSV